MKIIFIGIVDFSYHCLSEVLANNGQVSGVITSENRKNNSDYSDLKPLSEDHNIPIHFSNNVNSKETIGWVRKMEPDIIFCFGWSQLIGKELLSIPKMGIIGSHPTMLPENRGRHPLIWSIILGLEECGLTFFFMDEGADSGPIFSQERIEILRSDSAYDLYNKIKTSASKQIKDFLPRLMNKQYQSREQVCDNPVYWRKRSYLDGVIDFRMAGEAIYNLVRALTKPYPGAQFKFKDKTITVWEIDVIDDSIQKNYEPGRIISTSEYGPIIKCYDGAILLKEYEPKITLKVGDYIL